MEFKIIITRDRKQFRFLKKFKEKSIAIDYFKNLIKENKKVKFDKQFVNYAQCTFHIELLSEKKYHDVIEWEKDELGRNTPAPDRKGFYIWKIDKWREPEEFRIYSVDAKFNYDLLYDMIIKTKDLISMSTIKNHLILDVDGKPIIVILKNVPDAKRLYRILADENIKNLLPFGVMSAHNQRKFLAKVKEFGIPTKMFYTKSTRW